MTGPKPVALPLGYTPIIHIYIRLPSNNINIPDLFAWNIYMPLTGTFRKVAILIAFSSRSLILIGLSYCTMGNSFFPLIHR